MGLAQDFQEFWANYPRKVGRLAAEQSYLKARKRGVTQQQLLEGIAQYRQHKPDYCDWAHPKTWLNQGRWEDEYDTPTNGKKLARTEQPITPDERKRADQMRRAWGHCRHDPACESYAGCIARIVRGWRAAERRALTEES